MPVGICNEVEQKNNRRAFVTKKEPNQRMQRTLPLTRETLGQALECHTPEFVRGASGNRHSTKMIRE